MSSSSSEYMQFMHDTRTDVWIAEQTGIPRSTLGFVRRGEREMPAQYTDALRTLYQGESTTYLTNRGYPTTEAVRLSSSMPDQIRSLSSELDGYIEKIAELHTAKAYDLAEQAGKAFNENQYFADALEKIKANIARSDLSYSDLVARFKDYA